MDIAAWTVRLIQPNNDLQPRCGDHTASKHTRDIPQQVLDMVECLVEAFHPERIYLFGSFARGDTTPDSDYDLLLVVPDSADATSDETVEISVEADFETHAEERRRFAILNVPRNLFSEASGAAARRSSTSSLKNRMDR